MLNPDLSPRDQLLLFCLLGVIWVALFSRVFVFFRLEKAGVAPPYPQSWTTEQRQTVEKLRSYAGLGLIWFWAIYTILRPSLPTAWSFRYLEASSLIALMTVSYAWVLLLVPRNLRRLDSLPSSFPIFITFLVIWWGAAFVLIGWILSNAVAAAPLPLIPNNIA